jgi:broad specificity phosphatase PhoE
MIRLFLTGLILLGLQSVVLAQNESEIFTIYLVRHAEKESEPNDPGDPSLSFCGELRAQALVRILSDIRLESIYSTPFERTLGTARPIAESKQLEIEIYDPSGLEEFSQLLLDVQQDALIVGHSNTTGVLAGLLAGKREEAFDEDIYDRLYQVVISGKQARINLLHQFFHCEP